MAVNGGRCRRQRHRRGFFGRRVDSDHWFSGTRSRPDVTGRVCMHLWWRRCWRGRDMWCKSEVGHRLDSKATQFVGREVPTSSSVPPCADYFNFWKVNRFDVWRLDSIPLHKLPWIWWAVSKEVTRILIHYVCDINALKRSRDAWTRPTAGLEKLSETLPNVYNQVNLCEL